MFVSYWTSWSCNAPNFPPNFPTKKNSCSSRNEQTIFEFRFINFSLMGNSLKYIKRQEFPYMRPRRIQKSKLQYIRADRKVS